MDMDMDTDMAEGDGHENFARVHDHKPPNMEEILPSSMLGEILSRVSDARDLARASLVSTSFRNSSPYVKFVRFLCRLQNVRRSLGQNGVRVTPFKETVLRTVEKLKCVECFRLEIEDEMNRFKDDVIEKNSLWLSERSFVQGWLPPISHTLKSLTVIDFGQQAIFQSTPLLQLISQHCKQLETLELRNMFLDCKGCEKMNTVTSLTLRCVKLMEHGLKDINNCMPKLESLTLITVVGLIEAKFTSDCLKLLFLGLVPKVNCRTVVLNVKALVKLQLKLMTCPDELIVTAPNLECLAVSMDKRENARVKFNNVNKLKELLMGSSGFSTVAELTSANSLLRKAFLDVHCMSFESNGVWKGVLQNVKHSVPQMDAIRESCPLLDTLSVGPGLWYFLEQDMLKKGGKVNSTWPNLKRLVVHLVVQNMEVSLCLITALLKAIPTLITLEVYVHNDSTVAAQEFYQLKDQFSELELKCDSWKKGLKFDYFSF